MSKPNAVPSVSVTYAQNGTSTQSNELGMRPMQERAYQKRGEQYLLIKSPPASGKSRALMFIALDKLENQGLQQAIIAVPEKSIGSSFHNEPLSQFGFWGDWQVEPRWNLCDAPGGDNGGKVDAVKKFLDSDAKVLVCTHATFRFAVEKFGVEAFDDRLIAVDEFHHVSANPDNKLGDYIRQLMTRDKIHIVAMTGSYFRGDAEAVLHGVKWGFGGNRRWEERYPAAAAILVTLAEAHSQQDPSFTTSIAYTRLTAPEALRQLQGQGVREDQLPALSTMAIILNRLGYRLRPVVKAKPQKTARNRLDFWKPSGQRPAGHHAKCGPVEPRL